MTDRSRIVWTPEMDVLVQRLLVQDQTARQIAKIMGLTKGMIAGRVRRQGYTFNHIAKLRAARDLTAVLTVVTDDAAHVTACLRAGGFGRLPIPRREPIQVWRAA